MRKRHHLLLVGAVSASLVLGCGDSDPKTTVSNETEPKTADQPGDEKRNAKVPKNGAGGAKKSGTKKARPAPPPGVPWMLAMPAGVKYEVSLRAEAGQRFVLEKAGRFSGVYELRGSRLVMVEPSDRVETGFEWEARGPDEFTLAVQRPELETDYVGATMTRLKDAQAKKPPAP